MFATSGPVETVLELKHRQGAGFAYGYFGGPRPTLHELDFHPVDPGNPSLPEAESVTGTTGAPYRGSETGQVAQRD